MPSTEFSLARDACEKLAYAFVHHADAWQAEAVAQLFTADGVFDRPGLHVEGREAIAAFIAGRPRDVRQEHRCSHFIFELAPDGRSATGTLDLELKRGTETIRARYHDRFQLVEEGWRIRVREVRILPDEAAP